MGILDFFVTKPIIQPNIKFGRYSDNHKEKERHLFWDKSVHFFEKSSYQDSFIYFLKYLENTEAQNVQYAVNNELVSFKIFQGSKILEGQASADKIKVEAKIATIKNLHIGFLRRILELNFGLKFSRYALNKQDTISLIFETNTQDASPFKLYAAFKELALGADKQDDVLCAEFNDLVPINMGHIDELDERTKQIKYSFLIAELEALLNTITEVKLDANKYAGAISYILLDKVYALIYLLNAKGYSADILERIHTLFFEEKEEDAARRNQKIISEIKRLLLISKEKFSLELYQIKSTFGVIAASPHSRLTNFIAGEIRNITWYENNRHTSVSKAIPGYIVGYCLFSYGLPPIDKELLHLLYLINYSSYFDSLGFEYKCMRNEQLNKKGILAYIKSIEKKYQNDYSGFKMNYKILDFTNEFVFEKSYLKMIETLQLK